MQKFDVRKTNLNIGNQKKHKRITLNKIIRADGVMP